MRIEASRGELFPLSYDKLIVGVGSYSQTFGIPGVKENAYFLKDIRDARAIRARILECESARSRFFVCGCSPSGVRAPRRCAGSFVGSPRWSLFTPFGSTRLWLCEDGC